MIFALHIQGPGFDDPQHKGKNELGKAWYSIFFLIVCIYGRVDGYVCAHARVQMPTEDRSVWMFFWVACYGNQKLNSGSLQGQYSLLTTEASLLPSESIYENSVLNSLLTKVLKHRNGDKDLTGHWTGAPYYTHRETEEGREKAISLRTAAFLFMEWMDVLTLQPLCHSSDLFPLLSLFICLRQGPNRTGWPWTQHVAGLSRF